MQGLRDEEVMIEYQNGEMSAMDELLRRYKNPIYHFALRLTKTSAEAEDIAQEVFLRVHQSRESYKFTGKFSTWIFSIAHNAALSRIRKYKRFVLWPRKPDGSDEPVEFPSLDPSPKEIASEHELSLVLKKHVQSLPFLQREALILREYQNLDYGEIASILRQPLGTVKTLIHRARQQLKEKLLPIVAEVKGGLHE